MSSVRIARILPAWLALSGCDESVVERGAPDAARKSGNSPDGGRLQGTPGSDGGRRHPLDGGEGARSEDASVADGSAPHPNDGSADSNDNDAGNAVDAADAGDAGTDFVRVPNWSVRKRFRSASQSEVVLEEMLASFADAQPAKTRVRSLPSRGASEQTWSTPDGAYVSDICRHPSGDVSAVVTETSSADGSNRKN